MIKSSFLRIASSPVSIISTIVILRLLSLGNPDLIDTTEGRYATVAKLMVDRGDWVTPWINYHGVVEPYLGKPPLHFWLMNIAYVVFGQTAFAARLPGLLSAAGISTAIWVGVATLLSVEAAWVATMVIATSGLLFFLSGAVVLDVTLTLGITIALVSFLLADKSRWAGYLFFVGLGVGVLVKGPLACVLAGITIVPWALACRVWHGKWPSQLCSIPWVSGSALFLAIIVPWYIWAEIRNPGFLKYFLWDENVGRYLKSDYGDKYGTGHRKSFGAAFGFLLLGLFPWSFLLVILALVWRKRITWRGVVKALRQDSLLSYSCAWTLSFPVVLLAAKQYTGTYIVPSLPGFALLVGVLWERLGVRARLPIPGLMSTSRILLFFLGVTGSIGAIISVWFGADVGFAIIVALAGLLIATSARALAGCEDYPRAIYTIALSAVVLYVGAITCLDTHLSTNRSSLRLLERAREVAPSTAPLRIGFPFYIPFSTAFYGPALASGPVESVPLKDDELAQTNVDLIIVRKRNLSEFEGLATDMEEITSLGQWRIFRRREK